MFSRFFMVSCSLLIMVCSLYGSPAGDFPQQLNQAQAENYSREVVANLFGPRFDNDFEGRIISQRVMARLMRNRWLWYSSRWTTHEVYEATLSGIVDYVEERSFDLAKKETGNCEATYLISARMRDECHKAITSSYEFRLGALRQFAGTSLENKIKNISFEYSRPWQRMDLRYDSRNCRCCNSKFERGVRWVYLACGHDLCVACASGLARVKNGRCPTCRWPINNGALNRQLTAPSAPLLD